MIARSNEEMFIGLTALPSERTRNFAILGRAPRDLIEVGAVMADVIEGRITRAMTRLGKLVGR